MAFIEHFRVTGLAGRGADVERELDRHVNVFWGLNGTGKTTLLRILHSALNNDAADLRGLPFDSAEVTFRTTDGPSLTRRFSKNESDKFEDDDTSEVFLSGEVGVETVWIEEDVEVGPGWLTDASEEVEYKKLTARYNHSYLPITRVSDNRRRPNTPSYYRTDRPLTTDEIFVRQVRARWTDYSNKSLSRIRDIQQQGLAAVLAILFGGIPNDQVFESNDVPPEVAYEVVRSFLGEQNIPLALGRKAFSERYEGSPAHRRVVNEIEEVRKLIATVLEPQQEFQSVIDEMYAGNKHLVLGRLIGPRNHSLFVRMGEKSIPLKSLSSGEKQLLQILLEALGANEDTVMIDEPELSMHVDWQQRLVGSMTRINPGCQLLLATHSPEVMADVPDHLVFEL